MKMKLVPAAAVLTALLLAITGCDALLNPSSMFAGFDGPDTAKIAGLNGTELIDTLAEQDGSDEFYDSLSDSETDKIDTKLAVLSESSDPETASEASLARVELTVKTNQAVEDTINNIADLIIDPESVSTTAGLIEALTGAIPRDTAGLAAFLADMSTISDSYDKVTVGSVDAGDLQTFIVAAIFDTISEIYTDAGNTIDDAAAALLAFMENPNADITTTLIDTTKITIPVGETADDYVQSRITGTTGKITTLTTLANLAGLSSLADTIEDAVNPDNF